MNSIAIYLFFLTAICTFRQSKYWPNELKGFDWLGGLGKAAVAFVLGTVIICFQNGFTVGLLLTVSANMLFLSAVIFFANCHPIIRHTVLTVFHIFCLIGIILSF